ncbi:hypothetical protein ACFV0C_00350 [Streptomyces sp. NPDC059568]|uniref:hypothetical protein n=1 Tax=Streptomyces sp. NPDC059568 TaxID=3346868 RepID=UPI00368B9EA4
MSDTSALGQATSLIEKAWGRPIDALETLAINSPVEDPLLRSAMHIRSALLVLDTTIAAHQQRLHTLTRPGHVPAFYDLERITSSATDLRLAHAESRTALQAISRVIEAREATTTANRAPTDHLTQAATTRSTHLPRSLAHAHPAPSTASPPQPYRPGAARTASNP